MYGIIGAIMLVSLVAFLIIERKLVRKTE
jgi:hypothetical protein